MRSIPFRLLVLSNLDLQDAARCDRLNWSPPGAIEESEHQPLWKSKPNTTYPQELGLILLSAQPATVKTLRLTVELTRTPAQIVVFTALPPRIVNELNPLDAVSRYLSCEWKRCCEPLIWEVRSSARFDTFRDTDSRIVRLDVSECSFLKLVVHAPHKCPNNESEQIVLEDIELLGSEDSVVADNLDQSLSSVKANDELSSHRSGIIHRPLSLPFSSDNDELQAVLLDAGVPMDLVVQVATICEREENENMSNYRSGPKVRSSNAGEIAAESIPQSNPIIELTALESQEIIDKDNKIKEPVSPFDNILRQYVEQTSRERHMLEEVLTMKICTHRDDVSSWQSPTVSLADPANTNEIILYTFGAFFTQCLLCGEEEIQVSCVQLVERVAPLLKKAIGTIPAFEGIVALIIVGVREAKSSQAFHATIHLAYTVFLAKTMRSQDDGSINHENLSVLGLIDEMDRANWSYGLRIILEWILASPFCWSSAKTISDTIRPHRIKPSDQSSKVPPSIDRVFLQFVRLLVDQDLTRGNFFNELVDITPTVNTAGIVFIRNRFRLFRLVLRNDLIRCHVSPNLKTSIQTLCTSILSPHSFPQRDQMVLNRNGLDAITTRLASECLHEIDRSASSGHKQINLLTSLHKHLEFSNNPNCHRSYRCSHEALFIHDPLSNAEETTFMTHLQRYFSSQPRPNALYRHSFVHTSASTSDEGAMTCELFQKGNISFQGHVVTRTPPIGTFHDEIQRNSAPFVFDVDDKTSTMVDNQNITSSFAVFRGSLERRIDSQKRSSKVCPEQMEILPTAISPSNKQHDTTYVNTTEIIPLSGTPVLQSPAHVATISTSVAKITNSNQILTTPTTQRRSTTNQAPSESRQIPATTPSAISPPISIAVVDEQAFKQPEDIKTLLNSSTQADRRSDNKATSKGKPKGKNKKDGKDSDNCVLQ